MYRITLVDRHSHEPLATWFDLDRATKYTQATTWEGANRISVATGSQWADEKLYRTASGRWVLMHHSRYGDNSSPWYYEIPESEAIEWLIKNGHDDAVPPEELDAHEVGAGAMAQRIIRMDDALWQAVQERARAEGTTASELIRRLAREYVG